MWKYLRISSYCTVYDFATACSTLNFLIYEENLSFFFMSVYFFESPLHINRFTVTSDHRVHTEWQCNFLAYIPSRWKNPPTPVHYIYHASRTKLWSTLKLRVQILYLYFYSTPTVYVLCVGQLNTHSPILIVLVTFCNALASLPSSIL